MSSGPQSPPSCVLAHSNQHALRSLKRLVEPSVEVVAMCDNGISLMDAIHAHEPALAVIEVSTGLGGGTDFARHLAGRSPGVRVIGIGTGLPEDLVTLILESGCVAYVPLEDAVSSLHVTVEAVLAGEPPPLAEPQ